MIVIPLKTLEHVFVELWQGDYDLDEKSLTLVL